MTNKPKNGSVPPPPAHDPQVEVPAKQTSNNKAKEADVESGRVANKTSSSASCTRKTTASRRSLRVFFKKLLVMSSISVVLVGLSSLVWYFLGLTSLIQLLLVAIVAYLAAGNYKWLLVAIKTAPRDIRALYFYIRILIQTKCYERKNLTLAEIFARNVKKHPHKQCLIFENQEWDFQQVDEYSNKIANVFKSHGYKKGDKVALFLENKPEFVCIWLGLSKLGVITPLINTNLRLNSLVHSITIAKSQAVIFGVELSEAVGEVMDKIEAKVALYQLSCSALSSVADQKFQNLDNLLQEAPSTPPTVQEPLGHHDHLVYIYTSGTTGLPKAAVITTARFIFITTAIHWTSGMTSEDRFYTPLPLYHTAGGCMTIGQMLLYGSTVVIRKKFSASAYFSDCQKYNCTMAQYIGEMCRYILAVPPKESDTHHSIKLMYGNGLRPQIWSEFVSRFNIKRVAEFYGATEGNANIVNMDNTVGAIGFISRIIPGLYPISIIKVDPHTGEPIRNAKGLCMACEPNEPGVFIGKIIPNNPSRAFLGYVDEAASKKKVVTDVYSKGDKAFISGDILIADELGNLYFKDRTGDTFRWKGENVSTAEVEAVISNLISYKDAVVYGVEIRGQEGRAGMVSIYDPNSTIELDKLAEGVKKALPSYARPIFLRILSKLDLTGTYKMKKVELQKDGFNPNVISDKLFYLNSSATYELLTKEVYDKIDSGVIRL